MPASRVWKSYFVVGFAATLLLAVLFYQQHQQPPATTQPTDKHSPADTATQCQSTIKSMPASRPELMTLAQVHQLWSPTPLHLAADTALVAYGRKLIQRTPLYFGKNGSLRSSQPTNALSCQNCHLEAGTRPFGNNYSAVSATYPKFRARSGKVEDIEFRINDCFRRSLAGEPPQPSSREMQAIKAYILHIGSQVDKGTTPVGAGIARLPYLHRSANALRGSEVYRQHCQRCHAEDGQGKLDSTGLMHEYPPLWGAESYSTAAGMHRLSHLAGFVKYNMPYGAAAYAHPVLSDDEAWDVAAYINSQPRPERHFPQDFPDISKKPVDYPAAPYADTFPQWQHKYGPFAPIEAAQCAKK